MMEKRVFIPFAEAQVTLDCNKCGWSISIPVPDPPPAAKNAGTYIPAKCSCGKTTGTLPDDLADIVSRLSILRDKAATDGFGLSISGAAPRA